MAPDPDSTDPEPPDDVSALLRGLELEPGQNLPARVRHGIERRFLGRDLIGFYWSAVANLVVEWLSASFERYTLRRHTEREQR